MFSQRSVDVTSGAETLFSNIWNSQVAIPGAATRRWRCVLGTLKGQTPGLIIQTSTWNGALVHSQTWASQQNFAMYLPSINSLRHTSPNLSPISAARMMDWCDIECLKQCSVWRIWIQKHKKLLWVLTGELKGAYNFFYDVSSVLLPHRQAQHALLNLHIIFHPFTGVAVAEQINHTVLTWHMTEEKTPSERQRIQYWLLGNNSNEQQYRSYSSCSMAKPDLEMKLHTEEEDEESGEAFGLFACSLNVQP